MAERDERADEQRQRVRLYVQVILAVDLFAYASDAVGALLFDELATSPLEGTARLIRWGVTVGVAGTWLLLRTVALPYAASIAVEVAVSLGLAVSYVSVALGYVAIPVLAPVFALLGIILILVVRASLVPSSVLRTIFVGVACLAILFVGASRELSELPATVSDRIAFMGGAIIIATSVSSRVIYGLRERVRDMTKLGQYTLESKLGEGGMGVVYRARHGMLRRPTAIKLLQPERGSERDLARFEREVRLTAQLTHPNTVTVFDYGRTPDGVFYYAMELLDGATLEDVVAVAGPQPAERVRRILLDCAGALEEAHAVDLVHRDIKPSNIMLCRQGGRSDVVKLLDFGLVKEVAAKDLEGEGRAGATGANVILGTPLYLSPEAIREPDEVSASSDLYALGAVGYFLLTGTPPFGGTSVIDICAAHLHRAPEPLAERLGHPVHPALAAIVMRCLEKDVERRPASAAELQRELRDLPPIVGAAFDADQWWATHGDALAERQHEESVSGKTIAVQPRSSG